VFINFILVNIPQMCDLFITKGLWNPKSGKFFFFLFFQSNLFPTREEGTYFLTFVVDGTPFSPIKSTCFYTPRALLILLSLILKAFSSYSGILGNEMCCTLTPCAGRAPFLPLQWYLLRVFDKVFPIPCKPMVLQRLSFPQQLAKTPSTG